MRSGSLVLFSIAQSFLSVLFMSPQDHSSSPDHPTIAARFSSVREPVWVQCLVSPCSLTAVIKRDLKQSLTAHSLAFETDTIPINFDSSEFFLRHES